MNGPGWLRDLHSFSLSFSPQELMDSPLPPSALPPRRRVEGSSTEHKQQLEREVSSALDLAPFQLANQGKASATEVSRQNRKMQPHMQSQVEVRLRLRLRLRCRLRARVRLRLRLRVGVGVGVASRVGVGADASDRLPLTRWTR